MRSPTEDMLTAAEIVALPEDPDEDKAMQDHWNGEGSITFYVLDNGPTGLYIEVLDHSGCAGGLDETIGIDYAIDEGYLDLSDCRLIVGYTYTLGGLNVEWTRGDGWSTDDDSEYTFETFIGHGSHWLFLRQTAINWWHNITSGIEYSSSVRWQKIKRTWRNRNK